MSLGRVSSFPDLLHFDWRVQGKLELLLVCLTGASDRSLCHRVGARGRLGLPGGWGALVESRDISHAEDRLGLHR